MPFRGRTMSSMPSRRCAIAREGACGEKHEKQGDGLGRECRGAAGTVRRTDGLSRGQVEPYVHVAVVAPIIYAAELFISAF